MQGDLRLPEGLHSVATRRYKIAINVWRYNEQSWQAVSSSSYLSQSTDLDMGIYPGGGVLLREVAGVWFIWCITFRHYWYCFDPL